ncbi:MAG TPA: geranylgeranyl reductase family protein [Anaerolineales bacterium]|nr:geranylgeranyl reductase family protein [Anaerolineales bacterium]
MSDIYDVVIVGAGPGGGTAAYFLGEARRRVLVLEKESLPRYKPCGGGLSSRLLEQFPFSFEPVIESRVKEISYALGKHTVTIRLPANTMRMVMRDGFDTFILAHANVEVRQGVAVKKVHELEDRVIVETGHGDRFEGRYLIASDGANSIVARSLGLRQDRLLAAAIEVEVPVPPDTFARLADTPTFIFGEIRLGYLWIFPKSKHLSVGIGALHPKPGELQATLRRVMARYGIPLDDAPLHGHPLPIYTRREPIASRRTLLVGDAAGLVDPFSGEGIRFAVKSGRLAAETILAGHPERYPGLIHRQIGLNHTLAVGLGLLFYHLPGLCYVLGVRNPFATYAFVDLLSDQAGYAEVILRLFGSLPVFLLTESVAALAGLLGGPEHQDRIRKAVYPA